MHAPLIDKICTILGCVKRHFVNTYVGNYVQLDLYELNLDWLPIGRSSQESWPIGFPIHMIICNQLFKIINI